jgi:hypothetical protein
LNPNYLYERIEDDEQPAPLLPIGRVLEWWEKKWSMRKRDEWRKDMHVMYLYTAPTSIPNYFYEPRMYACGVDWAYKLFWN